MIEMARHVLKMDENSIPKVALRWMPPRKNEPRMTNYDTAKDSDGGAAKYGVLVEQGSGRSKRQDPVEGHCCSLISHWGLRGLSYDKISLQLMN